MADTPGIVRFPDNLDSADSLIRVGNGLVSTLVADLSPTADNCTLASTANWPPTGVATIQKRIAKDVDGETLLLPVGAPEIISFETSGGNNLVNMLRGQQGTTPAQHDAGDYVEVRITAGHHQTLATAVLALENYLFALPGKFIVGETPTGAVNGINAAFTSEFDFVPESVVVLVNGVAQRRVTDFNTSGTRNITLTDAPTIGDALRINYIIP